MSDTEEMLAGGIGGAAVRAGACRGRGTCRNLKAKLTCFSPVLSGSRSDPAQLRREIRSGSVLCIPGMTKGYLK